MPTSPIDHLTETKPLLAVVRNIEIAKTGIEYPLASGPATFTAADLEAVVHSQNDASIPKMRVYIGHPDDPRIHGQRHPGSRPSGEPALGSIENLHLTEEGQTLVGDAIGIPLWLARILGSAYPSRSVEGNFNVGPTPGGHTWQLILHGLALLGVCWPGISTLEDIAALYTPDGPGGVEVIEATSDAPVTVVAASGRIVRAQMTVEDLKRQYYDQLTGEQAWWWIREIYINPDELIVEGEENDIYRVPFTVNKEDASFGEAKHVKIKYVNAGNSQQNPHATLDMPNHEYRVVAFANAEDSRPAASQATTIEAVITKSDATVIEPHLTNNKHGS